MAVSTRFTTASSGSSGTPTSAPITLPTTQAGDRLYIAFSHLSTGLVPTTPAGWTVRSGPTAHATFGEVLWERVADGTESGATITSSLVRPDTGTGTRWAAVAVAVSGTSAAPTIASVVDTVVAAQDTVLDLPRITPTFDDAYLVNLSAIYHTNPAGATSTTPPAGWSETADIQTANGTGVRMGAWAATRQRTGGADTETGAYAAATETPANAVHWMLAFPATPDPVPATDWVAPPGFAVVNLLTRTS